MPYLTRKKLKLQLSPGLVASYDIQPGNGVGLFWDTKHTPDPHGKPEPQDVRFMILLSVTAKNCQTTASSSHQ